MCGIAGIIGGGHSTDFLRDRVAGMCAAMRHRGPDGEGLYVRDGVALGHVRLAIIDLSEAGAQPLANEDGSLQLVVNGEIYNYRNLRHSLEKQGHCFRSRSDSEVILHLYEEYGDNCLQHLDGMFALALWDGPRRHLLLARDRFGIKPLYVGRNGDAIVFASELTALLASGLVEHVIDPIALYAYTAFSYIPSPRSMIRNVRKLRPAECVEWEAGKATFRRYWHPRQTDVPRSYHEAVEVLQAKLENSVNAHMVADVPIASFLSGGVDSSLVTALAHRGRSMTTVCGGFPGSGVDESSSARAVAMHLGTTHREVSLGVKPEKLFSEAITFLDEPFGDSSAMPTFAVCKAGRETAKVMLSGDGGDEAFGGYTGRYRVAALKAVVPVPDMFAGLLRRLPPWRSGRRSSLPQMLELAVLDEGERYVQERQVTTLPQRQAMFDSSVVEAGEQWLRQIAHDALEGCAYEHPVHRALWLDLSTSLADDMLTKVDRMSMAHGLEVRVPLLDYRLVEFALSLPPHWLVSARAIEGKRILRSVARPMLPKGIFEHPKQGFVVPLNEWLKKLLTPVRRELIVAKLAGLMDVKALDMEVLSGSQPRQDIYSAIVLAHWLQRMGR